MVKPSLRTKSIGFKVSEEEYSQTGNVGADRAGGRSVSGAARWCWRARTASRRRRGRARAEAQALMAELVALRAILLNVLFKLANGEKPTAEEMQRLIDRADSDKLKKARERLAQAAGPEGPEKQP